ncbi:MAG: CoA transferase [Pseudomonadales bacterium]|nr:CoA transferase [Pseudomonadales bacterium]MBO6594343.1 CoA transferase [Pseudomonadales bacterium]MBO6822096.1 CoA transferase [Pseudomonadales bacterium]
MVGPLTGTRIIELAGIGPGPFCGMLLADMGAEVIRVDRAVGQPRRAQDVLTRGRKSIAVDLKSDSGKEVILKLCESSDALFEGFRPGVTERLGVGPADCMGRNEKLVYGRMTGWGQEGPMAQAAGHDINYISLIGALHAIGDPGGKPVPPLNLVGDFGGGGMFLAFGMVCAMLEAQKSGKGQVVDAAMVDGAATLMAMFFTMQAAGAFSMNRGTNLLDGGAHFYGTYETKDGKYISLGSIEPQFYALLVEKAGLDAERFSAQMDQSKWGEFKVELTEVFKTKTRDEWREIMEGTDVCFAPILALDEVHTHPHAQARHSFVELEGVVQPAPAPRFSRTEPAVTHGSRLPGEDTVEVLQNAGLAKGDIDDLLGSGAVVQA